MKATIERRQLKIALAGLGKVIDRSSTLPILGCIRFDTGADGVVAQATNLDQTARFRFENATSRGSGAFVLPLTNLKELAKGKQSEEIEFETGTELTVAVTNHVSGHAVRQPMHGMDPDDWPACPARVETRPAPGFLDTYRRLVPFASKDTTRYVLNSVHCEVAEKGEHPVTMIATDGRRLSLWNTLDLPLSHSVIVPTTKFLAWTGLEGEEAIALRTERDKKEIRILGLVLQAGPWTYDVRLVDGTYPNWRQVLPPADAGANRITFTHEDVEALKKILPGFPGTGTDNAAIGLQPGPEDKLVVSGRSPDDEQPTTLELTGGSRFEGGMPGVGVNPHYLLEALDAGFRMFRTADELSPLRADDGHGGIHVLMPIRLNFEPVETEQPASDSRQPGQDTPAPAEERQGPPAPTTPEPGTENSKTVQKRRKRGGKGERKTMPKGDQNGNNNEKGALEKLAEAC